MSLYPYMFRGLASHVKPAMSHFYHLPAEPLVILRKFEYHSADIT